MKPETMIGDMRRRIRAWVPGDGPDESTEADATLEALESDLTALEARLQALLPDSRATTDGGRIPCTSRRYCAPCWSRWPKA